MSDTQFIDDVIEREQEVDHNLKAVAEELGVSKTDLVTGASPEAAKTKAELATLFKDGETAEDVIGDTVEEKAETAAALVEQNAANSARIAKAAGVLSTDIAGSPGTTDAEESKAAFFSGSVSTADTGGEADVEDDTEAFKNALAGGN